jgi:hypothetical protein
VQEVAKDVPNLLLDIAKRGAAAGHAPETNRPRAA